MPFFANPHDGENGYNAGIYFDTDRLAFEPVEFIVDPLGRKGGFYSEPVAIELSERHAATANRFGATPDNVREFLPSLRRV